MYDMSRRSDQTRTSMRTHSIHSFAWSMANTRASVTMQDPSTIRIKLDGLNACYSCRYMGTHRARSLACFLACFCLLTFVAVLGETRYFRSVAYHNGTIKKVYLAGASQGIALSSCTNINPISYLAFFEATTGHSPHDASIGCCYRYASRPALTRARIDTHQQTHLTRIYALTRIDTR